MARDLGQEGANFQALLKYVVEHDKETYERLLEFLNLVVPAFQGLVIKDEQVFWQLEITKNTEIFSTCHRQLFPMASQKAVLWCCCVPPKIHRH